MSTQNSVSPAKKRFLVIQTAWIGDAILALPIAQELRKRYPDAEIHFLVREGNETIAANHPAVDRTWTWNKKKGKYMNLLHLVLALRKIPFTAIYNCQRYASSGILTAILHSKEKIGFDKNPFRFFFTKTVAHVVTDQVGKITHEVDRNLSLIGNDCSERKPYLFPGEKEKNKVSGLQSQGKYIVIAPASAWFTKQLPLETWRLFLMGLPADLYVFIVGSTTEYDLAENLKKDFVRGVNLCGKLSLLDSAALMQGAVRVFVNDSGALHLASGVNAAVTVCFCSTVPRFGFGPLSDDSVIVETKEDLSCRPCGLVGKAVCPEGHFRCGTGISVSPLLSSLR